MTTYMTQMCEGCQGSGGNWPDCDLAGGHDCRCEACGGGRWCWECDGFGYYDPDPDDASPAELDTDSGCGPDCLCSDVEAEPARRPIQTVYATGGRL